MYIRRISMMLALALSLAVSASAQGGWRQWNIYLVDGTQQLATPLGMDEKGRLTHHMGDEGIDRSKISYIAIIANDLPPVPTEKIKKDLVVLLDGTKSFGAVSFRDLQFSEGTVLQNGKEISTKDIAYIKFAPLEKKKRISSKRNKTSATAKPRL